MKFRVTLPVPSLLTSLPFLHLRIRKSGGLNNELSLLYL
jgi:hypothetical protein